MFRKSGLRSRGSAAFLLHLLLATAAIGSGRLFWSSEGTQPAGKPSGSIATIGFEHDEIQGVAGLQFRLVILLGEASVARAVPRGPLALQDEWGFAYNVLRGQGAGADTMIIVTWSMCLKSLAPGTYPVLVDICFDTNLSMHGRPVHISLADPIGVVSDGKGTGLSIDTPPDPITISFGDIETPYLSQNYPNPCNPSTTISFTNPRAGMVSLKVYNLIGQEVAALLDGVRTAGAHIAVFNGTTFPSGTYFYRLETPFSIETRKMILLK